VRDVIDSGQCWRPAGSTLAYLRGDWHAERRLTDHQSGRDGWFVGEAVFQPELSVAPPAVAGELPPSGEVEPALAYHEHGELQFGSHRGLATRSLIFRSGNDGTALVLFSDGRAFYQLDLRSGSWQAQHLCGSDNYVVTVRVTGADSYTEHWQARGPEKDYEMTTTLSRMGTPA